MFSHCDCNSWLPFSIVTEVFTPSLTKIILNLPRSTAIHGNTQLMVWSGAVPFILIKCTTALKFGMPCYVGNEYVHVNECAVMHFNTLVHSEGYHRKIENVTLAFYKKVCSEQD